MIGLSSEIPLVSHSDVTSPFPPSGNEGYTSNRDVSATDSYEEKSLPALQLHFALQQLRHLQTTYYCDLNLTGIPLFCFHFHFQIRDLGVTLYK